MFKFFNFLKTYLFTNQHYYDRKMIGFRPGATHTLETESKNDSDSIESQNRFLELNWNCDEWNSEL